MLCYPNTLSFSSSRSTSSFISHRLPEHLLSQDSVLPVRPRLEIIFSTVSTYTLPSLFDRLAQIPSYETRANMVENFDSVNKWKKRGLSCVPIIYEVSTRPTPGRVSVLNDGSIVVEVGGIEIGQGLWTKVKQMTAFCLKELWDNENGKLVDRVCVVQADSLSLVQGSFTGGSTTSEGSCEAVRLACNILVERLKPLKNELEKENNVISWEALVGQAAAQNLNLSASVLWIPEQSTSSYLNYGAAVSEVEIDVLTGATTILRSDISYDCGQSLNPAVDLGQVEGAFIQGVGFFIYEEFLTNSDGLPVTNSTWNYKIPTVDTIPKEFNVELINNPHNKNRVLSLKASGEPPLLLASSVHCAMREAIRAARMEFSSSIAHKGSALTFQMDVPTTMPVIKELCGLDIVEKYLESLA